MMHKCGALDRSMQNLSLQSPAPQPMRRSEPAQLGFHDEDSEMFDARFFAGGEELTEVELVSPVEETHPVSPIVQTIKPSTGGRKSSSAFAKHADPSSPTRPMNVLPALFRVPKSRSSLDINKLLSPLNSEAGSQPIDIVRPRPRPDSNEGAKNLKRSFKQLPGLRENLLAEAWERRRDHILQDEQDVLTEKKTPEGAVAKSVTEGGKSRMSPRSQGAKTKPWGRNLTDDDFVELRGCIDLGFVFSQDYIPDLCDTLPALEVCYAITQNRNSLQDCLSPVSTLQGVSGFPAPNSNSSSPSPITPWKISSPGDDPQEVKERLRHWAQAVACTVRQSC